MGDAIQTYTPKLKFLSLDFHEAVYMRPTTGDDMLRSLARLTRLVELKITASCVAPTSGDGAFLFDELLPPSLRTLRLEDDARSVFAPGLRALAAHVSFGYPNLKTIRLKNLKPAEAEELRVAFAASGVVVDIE